MGKRRRKRPNEKDKNEKEGKRIYTALKGEGTTGRNEEKEKKEQKTAGVKGKEKKRET